LQLEHALRGFPEIERLQLALVEPDAEVGRFWTNLGFVPTGAQEPYRNRKTRATLQWYEKPLSPWVIETERLRLRRFRRGDLDQLADLLADRVVMKYYPSVRDRDGAQAWLEDAQASYYRWNHGLWVLIERDTLAFAGQVGLVIQNLDTGPEVEVGYMVRRQLWGHGYAPEAARASLHYARRVFDYRRVIALIDPANAPSQRVAQKLEMTRRRSTSWWDREIDVWGIDFNSPIRASSPPAASESW
jgi:RimJ/RimL family protein N-acetyltransferase